MDAHQDEHPTDQILSSFGLGKLDAAFAEAVSKHLEQCPDCRKRVAEMSADSFLENVRRVQNPADGSTVGYSLLGRTPSAGGEIVSVPPPSGTLPPGLANHPDYEIKRELGRGGMGVVYLAHNKLMGRDEVLKVMSRHLVERPGVLERFLREIRVVARLRHPNIVTAYHATRLGESIVFAMEYVEGLDLSKMVKAKGAMPVAYGCNFVYQAALGLQHAHEEGLVHRDVKPGNLMLTWRGDKVVVKVLDFGLAKASREEHVDGALTSTGQALGTPDYIAPEQIRDAMSADIRSDIYSLGGTLYYLLSGRPPFRANSLYDIYRAHISQDADPLNFVRPEVPAELAALVAKMMAKEPGRRFQTPGEVAQALTPFFKKGTVAFKVPKMDVSQDSHSTDIEPELEAVTEPIPSMAVAGSPAPGAESAVQRTVPESQWENLIEVRDAESAVDSTVPSSPRGWPPSVSLPASITAALLGLIVVGVNVIAYRAPDAAPRVAVVGPNLAGDGTSRERADAIPAPPPGATPGVPSEARPKPSTEGGGGETTAESSRSGGANSSDRAGETTARPPEAESRVASRPKPAPPVDAKGSNSAEYHDPLAKGNAADNANVTPSPPPKAKPKIVSYANLKRSVINTIEMQFVLIPDGEFTMGSERGQGDADEHPPHKVRITRPFYLGVHELTQRQYDAVMGRNPSYFSRNGKGKQHIAVGQSTEEQPVEWVSWLDAVAFCNELSKKEHRKEFYDVVGATVTIPSWDADGYRLPTEAEWEYAAGRDPGNVSEYAWHRAPKENPWSVTQIVGRKPPNGLGLHDMLGNVREWCWDAYDASYYKNKQYPMEDPHGPDVDLAELRVVRGGGCDSEPRYCRSAKRTGIVPDRPRRDVGLRVACGPSWR